MNTLKIERWMLLAFLLVFLSFIISCSPQVTSIPITVSGNVTSISYATEGFGKHPLTFIWVNGHKIKVTGTLDIKVGDKVLIRYFVDPETGEILDWRGITFLGKELE